MPDLWKIKLWLFIRNQSTVNQMHANTVIITTTQISGLSSHVIVEDEQMIF